MQWRLRLRKHVNTYLFSGVCVNVSLPIVLIAFVTGDCGQTILGVGCETAGPGQT
jgi:hypothetical protein